MAFSDRDLEIYWSRFDPAYTEVDDDIEAWKAANAKKVHKRVYFALMWIVTHLSEAEAEICRDDAEALGEEFTDMLEDLL